MMILNFQTLSLPLALTMHIDPHAAFLRRSTTTQFTSTVITRFLTRLVAREVLVGQKVSSEVCLE
jgi:hypothetical protein